MNLLRIALAAAVAVALIGLLGAWAEAYTRAARLERELDRANRRSVRYWNEAWAVRRRLIATYAEMDRDQREAGHFAALPRERPTVELPADIAADLDQFLDDLLRRKER